MNLSNSSNRIAIVSYNDGQILDVTGPSEVFAQANRQLQLKTGNPKTRYQIDIVAEQAGQVQMSSGLGLYASVFYQDLLAEATSGQTIDTLLVGGGNGVEKAIKNPLLLELVKQWHPNTRRFGSICSGALVLAEAGILDHRRATSHWCRIPRLKKEYPLIKVVEDDIFVKDGELYTSAGITAGIDLALALVGEDLGRHMALTIAREMVVCKRQGGQAQFNMLLDTHAENAGKLKDLPYWIWNNLNGDLAVENMAEKAAMSPRNFTRVFIKELGVTPGKYVEKARLEKARVDLETSDFSLEEIAERCGFGNMERMCRTFLRFLKVTPRDYRKNFRTI